MAAFDEGLEKIGSLISVLSWRKIALFTVLITILGFSIAIFENRNSVYNFVSQITLNNGPLVPKRLSKPSSDQIDEVVRKLDLVVGIQITLVDFQRNTRIVTYTSIDDNNLLAIYAAFANKAPPELPLFNSDVINNKRLVDLVNGEFICNPYKETIAATLVPDSVAYIHTLCANAIPPFYGQFTGIIGLYLRRHPTPVEIDQIRAISKTLGLIVFQNDLR